MLAGLAIWLVSNPDHIEGDVFGREDHWKGLGIFFDTFQARPVSAVHSPKSGRRESGAAIRPDAFPSRAPLPLPALHSPLANAFLGAVQLT